MQSLELDLANLILGANQEVVMRHKSCPDIGRDLSVDGLGELVY